MQDTFLGLILGKNECKLAREFAATAIDVDLSYGDIRPIHCPKEVCQTDGECLTHVEDDCCKSDYWSECDPLGVIAVENGQLWCADSPCDEHTKLCVPKPSSEDIAETGCQCGGGPMVVRFSNVSDKGLEGPLSEPSNIGSQPAITIPADKRMYVSVGGTYYCQGDEFDPDNIKMGLAPVSEGWCECPSDVKFLERHSSGSLMTVSGKNIHVSHPSQPQLWGKEDICHCRDIISMMGINGQIFVFDGQSAFTVERNQTGYFLNEFDDNVCIKSPKQLTKHNGAIFLMTNDGPRSISGSQYNRSIFGYLNSNFINPTYFCGDNDWAIGVFGGKVHFTNGENAYIYDLLSEQPSALTESSLVPKGYHSNCDGIYYHMADGTVMQWNPCDTEYCPYTYCTSTDKDGDCKNYGVMEVNGSEFGDIRTRMTISYVDSCCNCTEVCEKEVCFCKTINITGCSNARGVKVCYTGTDIIFRHRYATAPMEMR